MTAAPSLTPLRGGAELGPVALALDWDGSRVLLDCGTGGAGGDEWVAEVDDLDGVWISHSHLDHCGALPELLLGRPRLDMVATPPARQLLERAIVHHPDCDASRAADIRAGIRGVPTDREFEFPSLRDPHAEGLVARGHRAGHLLGAAALMIELPGSDGGDLLYTGDFCLHDQALVKGADLHALDEESVDVLVMEGVLATDAESDAVSYSEVLAEFLRWSRERRGPLVAAVRDSGEAIEVAAALDDAGIECCLHESLSDVSEIYRSAISTPEFDIRPEPALAKALLDGRVVLAPGDQLDAGSPANRLAARIAEQPDARIAIFNRAYDSTPAGELLRADPDTRLTSLQHAPRKAASARRFLLPTHAPRRQLLRAVGRLDPRLAILVHGRESHLYALRRALRDHGFTGEIAIPENARTIPLA